MKKEENGKNYLIDSNIIIYASKGKQDAIDFFSAVQSQEAELFVSWITYIEVLGYPKLTGKEQQILQKIFGAIEKIDLNGQISQNAVSLRQKKKIGLGDSVIAATAITNNLCLVTHNIKDFKWIKGLKVFDPI